MESNHAIRIQPFGLSDRELRVLQTICLVSQSRPRTYELWSTGAGPAADLAIVNRENPEAVAAWQAFRGKNRLARTIMLVHQPILEGWGHQIGRPIMATRLLAMLDHMQVGEERRASNRHTSADARRSSNLG